MTNVWVTTDTHFHHAAMCKYSGRPTDFTERIIADWKGEVNEDDLVIHLGDVTWKDFELDKLPGKKILVRGNHDKRTDDWYFDHGITMVVDSFTMKRYGVNALFTHKPELFHSYDINICGHTHGLTTVTSPCPIMDISLEKWGYRMIPLREVMSRAFKIITKNATENGGVANDELTGFKLYPQLYAWDKAAFDTLIKEIPEGDYRYFNAIALQRELEQKGGK